MTCSQLEDYLNHDLNKEELARFEVHLQHCTSCSQRVHDEQHLTNLLSKSNQQTAVPGNLLARVDLARRRTRVRVASLAVCAAAGLLLETLGWWASQRDAESTKSPPIAQSDPPPRKAEPTAEPHIRVRVTEPKSAIIVQHETDDPTVTLVWVYTNPQRKAVRD